MRFGATAHTAPCLSHRDWEDDNAEKQPLPRDLGGGASLAEEPLSEALPRPHPKQAHAHISKPPAAFRKATTPAFDTPGQYDH